MGYHSDEVQKIAAAFVNLAMDEPRLRVECRGAAGEETAVPDQDRSLLVTLTASGGRAEAVLHLGSRRARLVARTFPVTGASNVATLRDDLSVVLADSFRWGSRRFGSPDALARCLLRHMTSRLETVLVDPLRDHASHRTAGPTPAPASVSTPARRAVQRRGSRPSPLVSPMPSSAAVNGLERSRTPLP